MELKWQGVFDLYKLKTKEISEIKGIKDGGIYIQFLEVEGSNIKRIIYVGTSTCIYDRLKDYYNAYMNNSKKPTIRNKYSTFILDKMKGNDIYFFFAPEYYAKKPYDNYYIVGGDDYYFKNICCEMDVTKYDNYRKKFLGEIKFAFTNIPEDPTKSLKYDKFLKTIEKRLINHLLMKIKGLHTSGNKDKYGRYDENDNHTCFGKIEDVDPYPYELINYYDNIDEDKKDWFNDFGKEIDPPKNII